MANIPNELAIYSIPKRKSLSFLGFVNFLKEQYEIKNQKRCQIIKENPKFVKKVKVINIESIEDQTGIKQSKHIINVKQYKEDKLFKQSNKVYLARSLNLSSYLFYLANGFKITFLHQKSSKKQCKIDSQNEYDHSKLGFYFKNNILWDHNCKVIIDANTGFHDYCKRKFLVQNIEHLIIKAKLSYGDDLPLTGEFQNFKKLKILDLQFQDAQFSCKSFMYFFIKQIIYIPNLMKLKINVNSNERSLNLSMQIINEVIHEIKMITYFNLQASQTQINDDGVVQLVKDFDHLRDLKSLILNFSRNEITNEGYKKFMKPISRMFDTLDFLDLNFESNKLSQYSYELTDTLKLKPKFYINY